MHLMHWYMYLLTLLKTISFADLVHKHQTGPDYRENESCNFLIGWPKGKYNNKLNS